MNRMNERIWIPQAIILLLVALSGAAVVFTREPAKQMVGVSFFGLMLAMMFFIFQAPDVALSQIVIGAVALPMMVMLSLTKVRQQSLSSEQPGQSEQPGSKESPQASGPARPEGEKR
jgi:uncharacterized MnhB-related membrane protein